MTSAIFAIINVIVFQYSERAEKDGCRILLHYHP